MTRIWKYVLLVILALLVLGILLGGTGLITGASIERTRKVLQLDLRLDSLRSMLRSLPLVGNSF